MKWKLFFIMLLTVIKTLAQTPEEKIAALGITLPAISSPVASYINTVRTGNLIFLSGKGPLQEDGQYIQGKLGRDLTIKDGYAAARLTAINQLAILKNELGELTKIKSIVKVNGFVNSDSSFYDQPKVINGFSDLMIQVFGKKGTHARTAIGVNVLPFNMAVEVEMIVEVE